MELALHFDAAEADAEQAALFVERLNGWCRQHGFQAPLLTAGGSAELRLALAADRMLDDLVRLQADCYDLGVQISFSSRAPYEEEEQ